MGCDDSIVADDDASSSGEIGNVDDSEDGPTAYNALANGERNMESPIRWILLSIFVSSMGLLLCSCYFCIFRKHRNDPNDPNRRATHKKQSAKMNKERLRTLSYGKVI